MSKVMKNLGNFKTNAVLVVTNLEIKLTIYVFSHF